MIVLGFFAFLTSLKVGDAEPFPALTRLAVQVGDAVTLPCNTSFYVRQRAEEEVQRALRWEAMGEDVASLQAGGVAEGRGYSRRVGLPPLERVMEGDFSLTLSRALLRDSDMYECVWQGQRTISTVWLAVEYNPAVISLSSSVGGSVSLPCYGHISRTQDLSHVSASWTRDGAPVLSLRGGLLTPDPEDGGRLSMETRPGDGDLTMSVDPVLPRDQGTYRCVYTAGRYGGTRAGAPEAVHLSMKTFQTQTLSSSSVSPALTTAREETATGPGMLSDLSHGHAPVTSAQSMGGLDEMISLPDMEDPEERLPWVRGGILGGVLLVTALVLGILVAKRKI